MKVSVIIVNYNVRYFLEQCLYSVRKALQEIQGEVIVIDNRSGDDSINYLQPKFPEVRFISNESNEGFAKACNRGSRMASGEVMLFLNPDTIIAEDTIKVCLDFMEQHPDCGALGVRMIDGSGKFLKESKRSFPRPLPALYKLFGLSRLFPHSKTFSAYHLGHLNEHEDHEVDVLAGAFLMVPKKVFEKAGCFDEAFFMYGEDIDLSYCIKQEGYKNYYLARTSIIHFKGESTRLGSLNYVRIFYSAMSLFVRKHYKGTGASLFIFFIHLAILFRAMLAATARLLRKAGLPFIDALLIILSSCAAFEVWTNFARPEINYQLSLIYPSLAVFIMVYLGVAWFAGLYDQLYQRRRLVRAAALALLSVLALYALLPEHLRFSRGIVVMAALSSFLMIQGLRSFMVRKNMLQPDTGVSDPYILLVCAPFEWDRLIKHYKNLSGKIIGRVGKDRHEKNIVAVNGEVNQLAPVLQAREIIFCAGQLTYHEIIQSLPNLKQKLACRFTAFESECIVGSDSSHENGEVQSAAINYKIDLPSSRRGKRLVDFLSSFIFLLTFPLHLFRKNSGGFFRNCAQVMLGKKTWVAYAVNNKDLPPLRQGVISPQGFPISSLPGQTDSSLQIDHWYARNYSPSQDIHILFKNYKYLHA